MLKMILQNASLEENQKKNDYVKFYTYSDCKNSK